MSESEKWNVLVVDDVALNIDILLDILDNDYDVSVAMDGESAIEFVEEASPDIILLDVLMPGLSGYDVCEHLKGNDKTKHIPIIFITSKTDADDQAKGLKLGAVDYIIKPFSPALIRDRINVILSS